MPSFKQQITRSLLALPGYHTKRRFVVFESDDWGTIRMPSREVFNSLVKKGVRVDNLSFNRYDSLESEDDLLSLFEVLGSVKDKNGNAAVLTANTIVANPDFEKIKESDFREYFYEPFPETLKRYPAHENSFSIMKKGIEANVFKPQFHGREHINVKRWMNALQQNIGHSRLAFENGMFDLSESLTIAENSFMDAFNYNTINEINDQEQILNEGLNLFKKLFGFESKTFIAPCYIWSSKLNKILCEKGINALQGNSFQLEPIEGNEQKFKRTFHYMGQRNKLGQIYLTRNAFFEPSNKPDFDWIDDCLSRMEISFRWNKPVIISTHRLNYIGFIQPDNRTTNLKLLKNLLEKIIQKWPDVEFISSDELQGHISNRGK